MTVSRGPRISCAGSGRKARPRPCRAMIEGEKRAMEYVGLLLMVLAAMVPLALHRVGQWLL